MAFEPPLESPEVWVSAGGVLVFLCLHTVGLIIWIGNCCSCFHKSRKRRKPQHEVDLFSVPEKLEYYTNTIDGTCEMVADRLPLLNLITSVSAHIWYLNVVFMLIFVQELNWNYSCLVILWATTFGIGNENLFG